jgi:hypothetical protein
MCRKEIQHADEVFQDNHRGECSDTDGYNYCTGSACKHYVCEFQQVFEVDLMSYVKGIC